MDRDHTRGRPEEHVGPQALVVDAGGGRSVRRLNGETTDVVADAAETDGAYAVRRNEAPPGFAAVPLHLHRSAEEAFWVLDGSLAVLAGERRFTAGAGAFVLIPRGLPHAIGNPGPEPVRWLTLISPASWSAWIDAEHELIMAADGPPDPDALAEVHRRFGLDILVPPPAW